MYDQTIIDNNKLLKCVIGITMIERYSLYLGVYSLSNVINFFNMIIYERIKKISSERDYKNFSKKPYKKNIKHRLKREIRCIILFPTHLYMK